MIPCLILGTVCPKTTLTQNSACQGNKSELSGHPTDTMLKKKANLFKKKLSSEPLLGI